MSKPVTAAYVRESLRNSPKRTANLSEAGLAALSEGKRGVLPAEVVKAFNKGRPANRRYVNGASRTVAATNKENAQALRQAAAKAGVEVGARGPLPKAAKVALGLSKA